MSRRYYMPPEFYNTYYGSAPVQPMVYYQHDGTWVLGAPRQRGRIQYRQSDASNRQQRAATTPRQRPVNRVIPQQLQQQQQQQQQQQRQMQNQQNLQRAAYIRESNRKARSASPIRRNVLTEDKAFLFNALRKEVKSGLSALKHVAMDIPKFSEKSLPSDCYNAMRQTFSAVDRQNKKWRASFDSIFGTRSAPSTPRSGDGSVMAELQKQISAVDQKSVEVQQANEKCDVLLKDCREYKETIQQLETEKETLAREKNEALTRLSEIAGTKLHSNNAAIADLSTENRPTKIAEKFRELYDNEWTEAVDELFKDDPVMEKKVIAMLLYIVKESFIYCTNEVEEIRTRLLAVLPLQNMTTSSIGQEGEDLLRKLLKATSDNTATNIVKTFLSSLENDEGLEQPLNECVKTFAWKCCEITWYMAVQSPQMYIECDVTPGSSFDSNTHMEYTQSGEKIDFLVWPSVYIEKNGALVSKGVVQPLKK